VNKIVIFDVFCYDYSIFYINYKAFRITGGGLARRPLSKSRAADFA